MKNLREWALLITLAVCLLPVACGGSEGEGEGLESGGASGEGPSSGSSALSGTGGGLSGGGVSAGAGVSGGGLSGGGVSAGAGASGDGASGDRAAHGGESGGFAGGPEAGTGEGGEGCELPMTPVGSVFDGDLSLMNDDDVATAASYSEITGDVHVGPEVTELVLPNLRTLGGDLSAEKTGLVRVSAPNLTRMEGTLWFYLNSSLLEVHLRSLEHVVGRVYIHRNAALTSLQLEALVEAGATSEISGNSKLPSCYLDVLSERFVFVMKAGPECTCRRSCGLVSTDC